MVRFVSLPAGAMVRFVSLPVGALPISSEGFAKRSFSGTADAAGLDSGASPRAAASHLDRSVAGSNRPLSSTAPRFTPLGPPIWSSVRSVKPRSS